MRRLNALLVAGLAMATGCFEQPTSPREPASSSVAAAAATTVLEVIDLDAGQAVSHQAYAVSDAGWVFVWNWGGPGLVRYTPTPGTYTPLPGQVSPVSNGRGDLLAEGSDQVMYLDNGIWQLSSALPVPPGWDPDDQLIFMWGLNNGRFAVGTGRNLADPTRSDTPKTGPEGRTTYYRSPLLWSFDQAWRTATATPLRLPAASDPVACKVTDVWAKGISNIGIIVGYASESSLRRNACPMRAIYWTTPESTPVDLPLAASIPGYSKVKASDINYQAIGINDQGVITGNIFVYVTSSYRAARWRPTGSGTYGAPEVLSGYSASVEAIDECGRVVLTGGGVWAPNAGDGVTVLPLPAGLTSPSAWAMRNGVVVGGATDPSLPGAPGANPAARHAMAWRLSPCP